MRQYDLKYSQEPDLYIANSSTVAKRIRDIYGKQAIVVNYPVEPNYQGKRQVQQTLGSTL